MTLTRPQPAPAGLTPHAAVAAVREKDQAGRFTRDAEDGLSATIRAAKMAAFLEAYVDGPEKIRGNARAAAERAGIGSGTPWSWRRRYPDFDAAWRQADRSLESDVTGGLYWRATAPPDKVDPRAANVAAIVWGKRHFPQDWSEKHIQVASPETQHLAAAMERSAAAIEAFNATVEQAHRNVAELDAREQAALGPALPEPESAG